METGTNQAPFTGEYCTLLFLPASRADRDIPQTLDALPAHLVTPFNGPIPPPNLLDKIARGVSQAKGPIEWPHGIRATRVKLIELARNKHKDETLAEQQRRTIVEEPEVEIADDDNYGYTPAGVERSIGGRRPPYKQSSMDFLDPAGAEGKQSDTIARYGYSHLHTQGGSD